MASLTQCLPITRTLLSTLPRVMAGSGQMRNLQSPRRPPDPWRQKMNSYFRIHDEKGDGTICKIDYMRPTVQVPKVFVNKEHAATFCEIWNDVWESDYEPLIKQMGDRRGIAHDDFLRKMMGFLDGSSPYYERMLGWLAPAFDGVDGDNDGVINPDEYAAFLSIFGVTRGEVESSLMALDTNKDGVIERTEFIASGREFFRSPFDTPAKLFFGPLRV